MPDLIAPTTALHRQWLDMRDDFGRGVHLDGSGLHGEDEVDDAGVFAAWVARLVSKSDPAAPLEPGKVHCTYWWIVEGDEVLGSISLRHELNDFLFEAGGNIGYSVRPAARRRGIATWALGAALPPARKLGLDRVLVTCDVTNEASHRTILRNGGVQEDIRDTSLGRTRRLWIEL